MSQHKAQACTTWATAQPDAQDCEPTQPTYSRPCPAEHLAGRELTLQNYLAMGQCDGKSAEEVYAEASHSIFVAKEPCYRVPQLRWSKRVAGKYRWVLHEMWPMTDPVSGQAAVLVTEQNISQVRPLCLTTAAWSCMPSAAMRLLQIPRLICLTDVMPGMHPVAAPAAAGVCQPRLRRTTWQMPSPTTRTAGHCLHCPHHTCGYALRTTHADAPPPPTPTPTPTHRHTDTPHPTGQGGGGPF
jgi:hypothetical protein